MAIFGNICLCLATLIFLLIASVVNGKAPPQGGDAAAGYPMSIMLFNIAFLICMVLATIAISWKGGFDWISPISSTRNMYAFAGLILAIITATLSALFKHEPGGVPVLLRVFSGFAPLLIPLVLIVAGFILLNSGLRESVPVAVYKWPLTGVFAMGVLGFGAGLYLWISSASENAARQMEGKAADEARYHQGHLDDIANCDVMEHMSRILVFTDANHDADVREAAIAKVKTNPQWQQELVRLLENQGAIEAFTFLASNEVDNKAMFAEPVNAGVLSIAEWIRQTIREAASRSGYFYADQFYREIDHALRTVKKFEGMGVDYMPAVQEMRAAFNEPSTVEKIKFDCIPMLDNWIKKRQ